MAVKEKLRYVRKVISPEQALALLGNMPLNRHISQGRVNQFAKAMEDGRWDENEGSPIRIAETGELLDGQHRLWAVIQAERDIEFTVLDGLPLATFHVFDTGRSRSTADILYIRGEQHQFSLGGAISLMLGFEQNGLLTRSNFGGGVRPLIYQITEWLDAHPSIRVSVKLGENIRRHIRGGGGRWAAIHYILNSIDGNDASAFLEGIINGVDLAEKSPILVLRKRLLEDSANIRKITDLEYTALIFKAWNAYRKGTTMQILSWRAGGANPEPYPKPE